jgi:hypothetical protein
MRIGVLVVKKWLVSRVPRSVRNWLHDAPSSAEADQSRKLGEIANAMEGIRKELRQQRRITEALRMQVTSDTVRDVASHVGARQLGFMETVEDLANSGRSFSRFGDGEFRLALRPEFNLGFQTNSGALREELVEIFENGSDDELLVGFPYPFRDAHWSGVWAELWPDIKPLMGGEEKFGNSHVTRPTFFTQFGHEAVDAWRGVWNGLKVCVIAGEGSRFDMIPALFDGVRSAERISAPAKHAFGRLNEIEIEAVNTKADVFLVALGPSGTILASRLARKGRRALDIGHISASYGNVFKGDVRPEAL